MVLIAQFVTSLEPGRAKWMLICYEKFTIQNEVKMRKYSNRTRTRAMGMSCIKDTEGCDDQYELYYLVGTTGCAGIENFRDSMGVVTIHAMGGYTMDLTVSPHDIEVPLEKHAEYDGKGGTRWDGWAGPGVSFVVRGDGELCVLANTFEKIARELKRQLRTRTAPENSSYLEFHHIIKKRPKIETKPKPIERPPVDPVSPDENEPEELDETQWEIIKKVETAHALSFCKLANQNEVENGQLDRNVCDGECQHAERIPTATEGEPGA